MISKICEKLVNLTQMVLPTAANNFTVWVDKLKTLLNASVRSDSEGKVYVPNTFRAHDDAPITLEVI
jgi:hypothetical protein